MAGRVDHVLDLFLRQITPLRGDVEELYLYGSRARGDHRPDSDYDVFVVLRESTRDTIDTLYDAVVEAVCESGSLVSLKIVSREQFRRLVAEGNPLVANVLQDGVPLALDRKWRPPCMSRSDRDDSTSEQLIAAYLEKARQKLDVARRLRDSGDHDDAISRAYYAAFHAARALLTSAGEQPRTHHGTVTLFNLLFVKTGKMSRRAGRFFSNLKDDRESADYELFSYADAETARVAVEEAESIVAEATRYLEGLAAE